LCSFFLHLRRLVVFLVPARIINNIAFGLFAIIKKPQKPVVSEMWLVYQDGVLELRAQIVKLMDKIVIRIETVKVNNVIWINVLHI
jgi:hypothetical protein